MKNKQYFFVKRYFYSFFRYCCSIFIVLLFASDNVFALPKCNADISDSGVSVQSGPTDSTNKLFVILKKDEIDKDNICYTVTDDYVKCDTIRLKNNGKCTSKFACQDGFSISCENGQCECKNWATVGEFVESKKCTDFNEYVSFESKGDNLKKACYPENHICVQYESYYKNNERLYRKDIKDKEDEFYVYKKNMINSGASKNCEFYMFSCDYKIEKESMPNFSCEQYNVVLSGTNSKNNKLFVENIFGSLGDMSFFVQVGECNVDSKNCTGNCERDSDKCSLDAVLKKKYYYKYYDNSKRILYYYEKNISTGNENNIGKICDKYLPSCIDLKPNESMAVLYDNRSNKENNNIGSRKSFYKNNVSDDFSVNESNLYYLASPEAAEVLCLSKEDNNSDVGYCSDLNENGDLKYMDGLNLVYLENNNSTSKPNCYLKSCIDLTPEEFKAINDKGKIDKKYCSEYYWLSNTRGLRYFPKEKPIYCSSIENNHLKFSTIHEMIICSEYNSEQKCVKGKEKKIEYYAGGGVDRNKGNCYLKNCYSLTKKERELVANAKINNLAFEIERACNVGNNCDYKTNFNYDNIPIYCDNGFLFSKNTPGYTNFEPINLNVIPCHDFSSEQLNQINNGKRVLLFTDLIGIDDKHEEANENKKDIKEYDSNSSTIFCRTHYVPLNLIKNSTDNNENESFFRTRIILADEKKKANANVVYISKLSSWGFTNYESKSLDEFGIKYFHDDMGYKKVKFTSKKLDSFKDLNSYTNILSYVDNIFPYYNADIASMQQINIFNGNEEINTVLAKIKIKNEDFYNCVNNEKKSSTKKYEQLADDDNCFSCVNKDSKSQDKCLYDKGNDCRKYINLEYECKVENCDNKDSVTKNYCYVEDFVKEQILDADFYITTKDPTGYLDCPLYIYANSNDNDKEYESPKSDSIKYFTYGLIKDFLEEVGKDKLDIIKAACNDLLLIADERELPKAEILEQLVKPTKVSGINFNSNNSSPGKHDLERYGCTRFNKPNSSYGLYGCKLPDVNSSYFNTNFDPVKLYKDSQEPTKVDISGLSVCSRYQDDVFGYKCGQREGGRYRDKCLDFNLDWEGFESNILDSSPEKSKWIFEESSGASRFRVTRKNRDIYVLRDFHTYHYCSATESFKGTDGIGYGYVYAAGFSAGAAGAAIPCGVNCAIGCFFSLFATAVCTSVCAAVCIPTIAAITATIYSLARSNQWMLDLQNDLHVIRGYNNKGNDNDYKNKGLITPAFVTDNNNYIYRFYPRADNIEEDLKNKLENNSGYFHENTLGVDILKKCGISINEEVRKSEPDSNKDNEDNKEVKTSFGLIELVESNNDKNFGSDLAYKIKKFDDSGKVSGDCNKSDIKNCLNEKQKKCIEGYGVYFFDDSFIEEIDKDFVLRDGGFLKRYNEGDIAKDDWGAIANPSNKNRDWIPVSIVNNTLDTQRDEDLKNNPNCKTGLFNDPIGDLSRCRGFSLDCKDGNDNNICVNLGSNFEEIQTFFTESQALKLPLAGHPFFFYTLVTPKNTPEIFDPSIFVKEFCKYSVETSKCYGENMVPNNGINEVVLNFFEPKLKISYDYNGGTAGNDFKNHFENENNFLSYIKSLKNNNPINNDYSYSCPYILKYKSDYIPYEKNYTYVLHRTFEQGTHKEYLPKVCLYKIINVTGINDINTTYNFYLSDKCPKKDGVLQGNEFIIVDSNVMCFPRVPMSFGNIVLSQSEEINYNKPYINAKIIDSERKIDYKLRQDQNKEDYNISEFGENRDLGFGLNFTRSYCSKLYYEYYKYLDQLIREKGKLAQTDINRINKSINSIESYIKSDCDKENGYEGEFLVNESEMKSKIDNKDINNENVVFKETVIVKKNNNVYGGFNEICVSDYDIDNIFGLNKKYNIDNEEAEFPKVFAFLNSNTDGVKTKCLLDIDSRKNKSCMVTDRFVYLYLNKIEEENYSVNCKYGKCKKNISNCDEEQCKLYTNVDTLERIPLKKYECILEDGTINPELLTDINNMTEDIAEKVSACYKGGFNYKGIVYKNINNSELETQCKCEKYTLRKDVDYNKKIFKIRSMTPREFGFCVDLKKPIICPAVRYYDSSKEYIDDNLALGKTKEEMDENNQQRYYEQHLWRTNEKIMGIIPSVFYNDTLGHAEFPASVYCEKEGDCIGGSKNVEGVCLGYWKTNVDKPVAICEVKQYKGKNVYEYKIKSGTECVRYSCPGIGNIDFLDEFGINKNTSNVFTTSEISEFNNIKRTDYRSFINNEEIDIDSVDKRGLSNGFALWEKVESSDFAEKGKFEGCLTGYGIAGSNYKISQILLKPDSSIKDSIENSSKYYKKLIKEKYRYFNDNLVDHSVRKLIYGLLYDSVYNYTTGQSDYNNIPKRYCNQKGEWMLVEDVYNKMVLDSNIYDNNLYHSDISSNLWLTIFNIDRDDISNNTTNYLADKISKYGYCERLVCKPIMQTDENYYMDEFFNSDDNNNYNKNMYMFWLHSGGADWKATSSPRNSSSGEKLIYDESTDVNNIEFSSRKLRNIFSSLEEGSFDDYIISNKYKYLKKVEGECKKEFGYYNRGTEFSSKDINTQIEKVKNSLNNKDNKYELASRDCSLNQGLCKEKCINLGNNASDCDKKCSKDSLKSVKCSDSRYVTNFTINGKDKPYRVCTSTGAWGEITNKCVRSCELLHLYRTNIDSDLYSSSEPSNVFNEDLKVENHNILSFNIDDSIENSYKEGRFLMYNFRYQELKNKNNYTQGEFIFGGADWPRSIVSSLEINNNYDCDSNGKCLRYIDVEGECNKEYETIDVSNPTQYVNSGVDSNKKPIKPKRKCYEDGTWGKVENRCILEKSCVNLDLYVSDVAKLIKKYNMSNTTLNDLNNTLSEIYVQHNKGNINEIDKLFTISAGGATAGSPISCNNITGVSGFETIKVGENEFACSSTGCCGNGVISMVCNSSDKLGTYIAGWSFNAFKLEKYFIPKTCSIKLIRDTENNNIHLKIDGLANNSFVCSSSDLYSRIDRLNFSFGANVNDYTISSLAKHYASESKLDLVYNSINNVIVESGYVIKKATGGSINAGVDDLSNKTINIDGTIGGKGGEEKIYYSHQIYATCDNRYFYNEISENNSENDYYNKLAIFSCQEENSVYKFTPINDEINKDQKLYESVKSNQYLLKGKSNTNSLADACQPKTCGGVGNNYQTGWSESFVKEFVDNENKKYNNTNSNTKFSTLKCPEGYAFVIDDKSSLDKNKNVELYYESNNENYSAYGFVQSLKVTCTGKRSENAYSITNEPYEVWNDNNKSSFRKINNKDANAYDANRHGDLQYEDLPKTFCRDIAKTNCNTVTEQEIINSGNIFIAKYGDKYENTEEGYCVRMGCPRKNLRIVKSESALKALQSGDSYIPGIFTLPKQGSDDYYEFNDVVVIQSLNGDYTSQCPKNVCGNSPVKFVQYIDADGKKIEGNLCEKSNEDIYNDGPGEYNYNTYYDENKNNQIEIVNCFDNLYSKDTISKTNVDGYEKVSDSLYIKYNDDYKSKFNVINNIKNIVDYNLPINDGNTKEKANNLIKENIFGKIDIVDGEIKNNVKLDSIYEYINEQVLIIEEYALKETKKLLNYGDNDSSYLYLCDENVTELSEGDGSKFTDENHKLFKCLVEPCQEEEIIFIKTGDEQNCSKIIDDKEEKVAISYYIRVSDFKNKFNEAAELKRVDLMNNFKPNESDNEAIKSLYNKYYNFYEVENYFKEEKNVCRMKYYNDFLTEFIGTGAQILIEKKNGEQIMDFSNDCSNIAVNESDNVVFIYPLDEKGNNALFNYTTYSNSDGVVCKEYSEDSTISDCDLNLITESVRNGYQKYFLDIFIENSDDNKNCSDTSTCNIKEVINYYNKKYSTGKEECEEIYSSYLEAKDKFDKDNSDKIKKGLFMIMKCTPEGWIVEGNPSCKKRCSGEKTVHVNPDGLGDYYVTIKVADLRHSKNTGIIEMGARRSQTNCSVGNMHAYRYNGASFSCDNSHMSTNLLDDDGGRTSNFKYHSHGLVWKIYCSGTFSAFGITTQRRANRGGTVSFPYRDSFCWRDYYNKELAVLCPGDKNISTTEGDAKIDCGNRKFDTVTNILYEIDSR